MRIIRLVFPLFLALSLSACGTIDGLGKDTRAVGEAMTNPQPMPTGYPPNPNSLVLKPRPVFSAPLDDAPRWKEVGAYEDWAVGKPAPAASADDVADIDDDLAPITDKMPPPRKAKGELYNSDVSVFPVDGDMADNGDVVTFPLSAPYAAATDYGTYEHRIFFGHGSSSIGAADRNKLKKIANRTRRDLALAITVVGHASRRVDRVVDEMEKKLINFRMAQRRADAVTAELKKAGLKPAWVQAVSRGDDEPNNTPPQGMTQEAADRRVEIYVDQQ